MAKKKFYNLLLLEFLLGPIDCSKSDYRTHSSLLEPKKTPIRSEIFIDLRPLSKLLSLRLIAF